MSDSLDSLDKAIEAEKKTQPHLPDVDDDDGIPIETVLETSPRSEAPTLVKVDAAPLGRPRPKKPEKKPEPEELDSEELEDLVEMTQRLERSPELEAALARTLKATANEEPARVEPIIPPAPTTERNLARTLPVNSSRPPTPQSMAPVPTPQSMAPVSQNRRPTSISPVALDVPTPPRPSAVGTQKLAAMSVAPRPKNTNMFVAGVLAAGGLALVGVIAAFALTSAFGDSSPSTSTASAPRKAEGKGVRVAIVDQPETAPSKSENNTNNANNAAPNDPPPPDEPGVPIGAMPSTHGRGGAHASSASAPPSPHGTSARSHHASRPSSASAPPAPPAAAPQAPAAAPAAANAPPPPPAAAPAAGAAEKPTTGTLIVTDADLMTIVVDGQHRRVQGGRVVVSCGAHNVRAGISGTRTVNVPCGGSTAL